MNSIFVSADRKAIAEAFALWEKEYREDPDGFMEAEMRMGIETDDYGERCAATFMRYMERVTGVADLLVGLDEA